MHANQASCSLAAVSKIYLATATHERWNALSFVSHDEVIIAQYKQELIFLQSTYAAFEFLSFISVKNCPVKNDCGTGLEILVAK